MTATDTITIPATDTGTPRCGWPGCEREAAWIARMPFCRHTLLRCDPCHTRAVALEALNHTYHHPGCDSRAQAPITWRPL